MVFHTESVLRFTLPNVSKLTFLRYEKVKQRTLGTWRKEVPMMSESLLRRKKVYKMWILKTLIYVTMEDFHRDYQTKRELHVVSF